MPTRGCPAKGSSGGRREDPQLASVGVVNIDGFGEAELGGEWSPALGWYRGTIDNHAEGDHPNRPSLSQKTRTTCRTGMAQVPLSIRMSTGSAIPPSARCEPVRRYSLRLRQ